MNNLRACGTYGHGSNYGMEYVSPAMAANPNISPAMAANPNISAGYYGNPMAPVAGAYSPAHHKGYAHHVGGVSACDPWNPTGFILVLFILLVLVTRFTI